MKKILLLILFCSVALVSIGQTFHFNNERIIPVLSYTDRTSYYEICVYDTTTTKQKEPKIKCNVIYNVDSNSEITNIKTYGSKDSIIKYCLKVMYEFKKSSENNSDLYYDLRVKYRENIDDFNDLVQAYKELQDYVYSTIKQ